MMKRLAAFTIRCYQLCISPYLGSCCRFEPSCSEYALQAIEKYGFIKAVLLILKRVAKCGPWHPGGRDEP